MPYPDSYSVNRRFCGLPAQKVVLGTAITTIGFCPFVFLMVEASVKQYSFRLLRVIYVCPALTITASVVTLVAYCMKVSSGYGIAMALSALSLFGWMFGLSWLVVAWITFPEYFGTDYTLFFVFSTIGILGRIVPGLLFQWLLYLAYRDQRENESRLYRSAPSTHAHNTVSSSRYMERDFTSQASVKESQSASINGKKTNKSGKRQLPYDQAELRKRGYVNRKCNRLQPAVSDPLVVEVSVYENYGLRSSPYAMDGTDSQSSQRHPELDNDLTGHFREEIWTEPKIKSSFTKVELPEFE